MSEQETRAWLRQVATEEGPLGDFVRATMEFAKTMKRRELPDLPLYGDFI
jgi:hypothetical protein